MRQTQSQPRSSWSHYAKAAAVFTLTTATYLIARTTGWLPKWFSGDKSTIPSIPEEERDTSQTHFTQRHWLQQSSQVTVINPIPDQTIQIGQPYSYSLDTVFSGDYTILDAVETGKTSLPGWLSLQYTLVSSYPTAGEPRRVAVSGSTVYVVNGVELLIVDVSRPSTPNLLGKYIPTSSETNGVAVSGSTVFLVSGDLLILDVSTPNASRLLSSYSPTSFSSWAGVVVSGNTLYMADWNDGLSIVDVSKPSAARLLGKYSTGLGYANNISYANDVAISGSTVFVTDENAGLLIVDVSNPSTPRLLNKYSTGSNPAKGVVVSGNTVFVTVQNVGLLIINVSTPNVPRLLCNYSVGSGNAWGVAVSGNLVFVADWVTGLLIMDVSRLSAPRLISSYSMNSGNAWDVAVSDNLVFVACEVGLLILDVSQGQLIGAPLNNLVGQEVAITVSAQNFTMTLEEMVFILTMDQFPHEPRTILSTQSTFPGLILSLELSSNLFVNPSNTFISLAAWSNGSTIVSDWIMMVFTPVLVGIYPVNLGLAENIAVSGSTMFVADGIDLLILDVSILSSPRLLSSYLTGSGQALGVAVSGNTVYLADSVAGVLILDVSTPGTPHLLGNYSYAYYSWGTSVNHRIAVSGSTIFVVEGFLLLILDVSTPSSPQLLSTYVVHRSSGLNGIRDVVVSGNTVYLTEGIVLSILDVTVLSAPRLLDSYSSTSGGNFYGIAVFGNTVFVADKIDLLILDMSILSTPRLLANYRLGSGQAFGVAVFGNIVFVAAGSAGLLILDGSQWKLTAAPKVVNVGNYALELMATDNLGGTTSIPFTIRVEGPPQLKGTIGLQKAWVGQPFNYFVPSNLFVDPNDDVIGYSADLADGKPLPSWLQFNPLTIGFGGTAQSSNAGNIMIVLSATDHICPETLTVNFTISVGLLPVLSHRISNRLAPIGSVYQFAVPKNSFYDPNGLALSYLAQGVNNQLLPGWLQFNATSLLFFGVANTSNITVYTLQLIATNGAGGQVIASFTLRTDHFPVFNKIISLPIASVNQPWVWALPSDAFIDADGDLLTYFATEEDGGPLPSWLSFNPITHTFTGMPLFSGIQGLKITAQDSYGGRNSTYFNMTILPESQSGSVINPPGIRAGKTFEFQVPQTSFGSNETLSYSAILTDGETLPSWLRFIASNLSFSGIPGSLDIGSYDITVTATDSQSAHYNVSFMLNVNPNYPPQVYLPISNQVAQVNEPFVFFASQKTFVDPNGDNLTYTVNTLPSWLSFDAGQLKFSGTPSRSDTDPLSARVVNMELTAHDDESQTSTLFTISVQGTSSLMLFLQVGIPLLSALASLYESYHNRALILNRCCKNCIVKREAVATTGEEFHVDLATQPEQVGKIQVKLPKPLESKSTFGCCARLFRSCKESPDHLPPAYPLPAWLKYSDNNRLFSIGHVPQVKHPRFTVQILNGSGVIREELNVTVQATKV